MVAGAVTVGLALLVGAVFVGYHFLAGPRGRRRPRQRPGGTR